MTFGTRLRGAFEALGLSLSEADGIGVDELDQAQHRLGHELPESLRSYYLLAGRHPVSTVHNQLLPPSQLEIDEGALVFMSENQGVVIWGIATNGLSTASPAVLQAPTGDKIEWFPEDDSLENFLLLMLHWQAVLGGLPLVAIGSRPTLELNDAWTKVARVNELTAYSRPSAALCIIHEGEGVRIYLGAQDAELFAELADELDVAWEYSSLEDA